MYLFFPKFPVAFAIRAVLGSVEFLQHIQIEQKEHRIH